MNKYEHTFKLFKPVDPKQIWADAERDRIAANNRVVSATYRWWGDVVGISLLVLFVLALIGCTASRATGQGILGKKPSQVAQEIKLDLKSKLRTDVGTLTVVKKGKSILEWEWTLETKLEEFRLAFDDKVGNEPQKKKPDLTMWRLAEKLIGQQVVVTSRPGTFDVGDLRFLLVRKIEAKARQPKVKPQEDEPVVEVKTIPSHASLRMKGLVAKSGTVVDMRSTVPEWLFPDIKIPEGPAKAEVTPPPVVFTGNVGLTFDAPEGAEIFVARPLRNCLPGASQEGLPYRDMGWYSLGVLTEWRTNVPTNGLPTEMHLSASKDGKWRMQRLMVRPGQDRVVDLNW